VADADYANEDRRPSGWQQSLYDKNDGHSEGMGSPEGEQRNGGGPEGRGWRQFANAGEVASNFWKQFDVAECDDGWRRIELGAQPLVNGVPGRMDKLRGFGNAIVAPLAAEFIRAYLETRGEVAA
jgi:DNA (cytosine-5)-methyltransferase 1